MASATRRRSGGPGTSSPTYQRDPSHRAGHRWWATASTTRGRLRSPDVGIAMGTVGATVSPETADAVIVLNRVDRIVDAIRIGRMSLAIARQSVGFGMGPSLVAMGFATWNDRARLRRISARSDRRSRDRERVASAAVICLSTCTAVLPRVSAA